MVCVYVCWCVVCVCERERDWEFSNVENVCVCVIGSFLMWS